MEAKERCIGLKRILACNKKVANSEFEIKEMYMRTHCTLSIFETHQLALILDLSVVDVFRCVLTIIGVSIPHYFLKTSSQADE